MVYYNPQLSANPHYDDPDSHSGGGDGNSGSGSGGSGGGGSSYTINRVEVLANSFTSSLAHANSRAKQVTLHTAMM